MKAHTPPPIRRSPTPGSSAMQREQPETDPLPREMLHSKVEADVSQFLASGHTITLVPIGVSAFDPGRQRNSRYFTLTEWDE